MWTTEHNCHRSIDPWTVGKKEHQKEQSIFFPKTEEQTFSSSMLFPLERNLDGLEYKLLPSHKQKGQIISEAPDGWALMSKDCHDGAAYIVAKITCTNVFQEHYSA